MDYLDIQISLDGIDARTNDAVRGVGSYDMARRAMDNLAAADFGPFKISVVVTRHNVDQLDGFKALADSYGAQLRVTRLRPSGPRRRHVARPAPDQRAAAPDLPLAARPRRERADRRLVLPPQRARRAAPGPEHVRRRPGRVPDRPDRRRVRLPVRHPRQFKAGSVRDEGGFAEVWKHSELFLELREPQSAGACASCGSYDACQGGCMAAKFFTGLPLDGPDPGVRQRPCRHRPRCRPGRAHTPPLARPLESQPATVSPNFVAVGPLRAGAPNDKLRTAVGLVDRRSTTRSFLWHTCSARFPVP